MEVIHQAAIRAKLQRYVSFGTFGEVSATALANLHGYVLGTSTAGDDFEPVRRESTSLLCECVEKMRRLAKERIDLLLGESTRDSENPDAVRAMQTYQAVLSDLAAARQRPLVDTRLAGAAARLCDLFDDSLRKALLGLDIRRKDVTVEVVAQLAIDLKYASMTQEEFVGILADRLDAGESTIIRRIRKAERLGLMKPRRQTRVNPEPGKKKS